MLQRSIRLQMMLLLALILIPVSAFSAPGVSIRPAGNGTFAVIAAGFSDIAGVNITVTYDSSLLRVSGVEKGSALGGALFVPNTQNAGSIKFAAVSTSPLANGTLATIRFDMTGTSTGSLSVSGTAALTNGKPASLSFANYTPDGSNPVVTGDGGGGTGTTTPPGGGSSTPVVGGTVTLPSDEMAAAKTQQQTPTDTAQVAPPETPPTPEAAQEAQPEPQPAPQPAAAPAEQPLRQALQSIPERFRLYQGARNVQKMTALFERGELASYAQDPPIAISDGEGIVTVTIRNIPGSGNPNFAFNGANYVSMKRTGDAEWQVQAKPKKGAVNASITMLADGVVRDFPLTVTPQARVDLTKKGAVTEADFERFLKERGTPEAPKFDLNGDGKRDYIDDYIFTANYLLAKEKEKTAEKKAPAQKKAQEVK